MEFQTKFPIEFLEVLLRGVIEQAFDKSLIIFHKVFQYKILRKLIFERLYGIMKGKILRGYFLKNTEDI